MAYLESKCERMNLKTLSFAYVCVHNSQQQFGFTIYRYSSRLLTDNNFQNPRAGPNDDSAHPPITPCKAVDPQTIPDPSQRDIYTLIVKHYLACCSRDAIGKETVLTVKMASEEFTAKGLMVLERNWLEIYAPWERWSTGQGELPNVQVGSRIRPNALLMKDGRTTAPTPISGEIINQLHGLALCKTFILTIAFVKRLSSSR